MALLTCPDCGKRISQSAYTCPECGRPFKQSVQTHRLGGKFEAAGFLGILTGIAACFYNGIAGALAILVGFLIFLIGRFL